VRHPWSRVLLLPALAVVLIVLTTGCSQKTTAPEPTTASAKYAGSTSCEPCHQEINDIWAESGHPVAMTKVFGESPVGRFPDLASYATDPVPPPQSVPWENVSYVAGGYAWKMLWLDHRGYTYVSFAPGFRVQYNFENQSWSYWGNYSMSNDPSNCGQCHATGYVPDEDWDSDNDLSDNQDGLVGMAGTFYAPGIHCEECHGRGSQHVADPDAHDLLVDRSSEDCGRCHVKDPTHRVLASYDFMLPNAHYDEWLHSGHAILATIGCNDCHDPHASVKYDSVAPGKGTHTSGVQSKIFSRYRLSKITLDYACYGCHQDVAGRGGEASSLSLEELSALATDIHQ